MSLAGVINLLLFVIASINFFFFVALLIGGILAAWEVWFNQKNGLTQAMRNVGLAGSFYFLSLTFYTGLSINGVLAHYQELMAAVLTSITFALIWLTWTFYNLIYQLVQDARDATQAGIR